MSARTVATRLSTAPSTVAARSTRTWQRRVQPSSRRTYASPASESPPSSTTPWILGGLGALLPAAWYFTRGNGEKPERGSRGDLESRAALSGNKKYEEDAKGGVKKRVDSHYQTNIGQSDGGDADHPAPSKPPGDFTTMSGKQKGLSNADTRHTGDPSQDPNFSKKGEGTVDTAKLQGTVRPDRPLR